jgi:hypothetical protein
MISCSIFNHIDYGRFGNQLFQYSLCKALSVLHNCDFHLNPSKHFLKFFNTKNLSYKKLYENSIHKYIEKDPFEFDKDILKYSNIDLCGFFQNLNYYKIFLNEIRLELQPNNKILKESNEYIKKYSKKYNLEKTLCLHFRRTDYTSLQSKHGFLDISYYTGIMKSLDYINVFIISDDIELVKREFHQYNIKQDNIVFVDNLDSYHDFYIMYLSGMNIIANSTFSWWASLLSDKNQHKDVYIPDQWIFDKKAAGTECSQIELYPFNWKRVSQSNNKWKRLFS